MHNSLIKLEEGIKLLSKIIWRELGVINDYEIDRKVFKVTQ